MAAIAIGAYRCWISPNLGKKVENFWEEKGLKKPDNFRVLIFSGLVGGASFCALKNPSFWIIFKERWLKY